MAKVLEFQLQHQWAAQWILNNLHKMNLKEGKPWVDSLLVTRSSAASQQALEILSVDFCRFSSTLAANLVS